MKKRTIVSLTLVMVVLTLLSMSCASTQEADPDEFRMAVEKRLDAYGKSLLTEDTELYASLHDENTIKMNPGAPSAVGTEELKKSIDGAFAAGDYKAFDINNEETEVFGDFGYARGNYTFTYVPNSGDNTINYSGKYLTIYKRQPDGSWKIYRDCFNSN